MNRLIAALTVLFLPVLPLFSQEVRLPETIHQIQPITTTPIITQPVITHPIITEPITQPNPTVEDEKIRAAVSKQIYQYQSVALRNTTSVAYLKEDNNYSALARFTVNGHYVAIRCVSNVHAVVAAFLDYIGRIFATNGSSADLSLEQIVRGARQDLRNRGFSDDDIALKYIDQVGKTHVVLILRQDVNTTIVCR